VLVAGVCPGAVCILLSVRSYDEVNVPATCMYIFLFKVVAPNSGLVSCFHFAVSLF
jgi:hypothetical protein